MKVVPEDVLTAPLEGAGRPLQSTAVGRIHSQFEHVLVQLTIANR